jgi:hypothetical protein
MLRATLACYPVRRGDAVANSTGSGSPPGGSPLRLAAITAGSTPHGRGTGSCEAAIATRFLPHRMQLS